MRTEISLAMASMALNLATYAHTVLAARYLGVDSFGAFTAAMNVLIVLSVVSLGLQTTVARRVAADPGAAASIAHTALRLTYAASAVLGLALAVVSPLIDSILRLDSPAAALLIAAGAVPLTIMGGQAGVLQGERRWADLAWVYAASGATRLAVGTALLVWQPTVAWGVTGIVAGMCAPVALGWWLLRARTEEWRTRSTVPRGRLLGESLRGAQALLAFMALSNLDVVVARHALSGEASGLYAAGLVLSKAVLFLPQMVLVRVYPALSTTANRRRALSASVGIILALGLSAAAVTALLPSLALVFVGGADFAEVGDLLWLFALLGTAQGVVQLFIYSVLARAATGPTLVTWAALLVMLLMGLQMETVRQMVVLLIVVNALLLLVLAVMTRRSWARGRTEPSGATS
ncbi:lipopolysaccharide biosynthesis protein [Nocardioides xinjiangensis]|uniref:lipopolysaccharide biosynthesis protein n=1 Tax=Nocardioides xinjiangensis TaxID=2817376 RepID=UPI001B304E03|nr:polysaccharide biosynthesis protein [Nocardioides sp. SYSU D00514]